MDAPARTRGAACGRNRGDPCGYFCGFARRDRVYLSAGSMTPCAILVRRPSLLRPGFPQSRVCATGAAREIR